MKLEPARHSTAARRNMPSAKALCLSLCLAMACGPLATAALANSEQVLVDVDRAQLLRLDKPAASVIIGNPLIADAAIQDQQMLIITGKSVGSTNLIVLDSDGKEILSQILEVRYNAKSLVTMHRGAARNSYSCSPKCEPTLASGDSKEYFDTIKKEMVERIEAVKEQASLK